MAYLDQPGWSRFHQPIHLLINSKAEKIPPHLGRYVLVYAGIQVEEDDPEETLRDIIKGGWIWDFMEQHGVAELRLQTANDVASFTTRVRIDMLLTREQEFILKLEKSHLLPGHF